MLCGLALAATQDGRLALAPGVAIDGLGREVLVPVAAAFDPRALTDACGKPTGATAAAGPVTVSLAYHPCGADPVPVLVPGCEPAARCAPGTVRESFAILVAQGAPPAPGPAWPPTSLFEPPAGLPRADAADVLAQVVAWVTKQGPEPPKAAGVPVVLAHVTIPADPKTPVTEADVQYLGRPVLLSQAVLFQMILALWERVEQGLAPKGP